MPVGYRLFSGPDFFEYQRASRQSIVREDAMIALKLDRRFPDYLLERGVQQALYIEPLRFIDVYSASLHTDITLLYTKQGRPLVRWYAEAVVRFSGDPGLLKHRPMPRLPALRGSIASKSFKVKAMIPSRDFDAFVRETNEKLRPISEAFWKLGDTINAFNAETADWLSQTREDRFAKFSK